MIKSRPLPDSVIPAFGREIQNQTWQNIINEENIDTKAYYFLTTIIDLCNKHFPEKTLKISDLDKKWITPHLKCLPRKIRAEFFRNRKSPKWKILKREWKYKKNIAVRQFHTKFVTELKSTKGSHPEKKAASFRTLSKSGLHPPPPRFGHLRGNFRLSRLRKKHTTKNYLKTT
mgnify:CR=1 FL=1